MTTVTVYDPPMCCSTGVCGPEVDPRLAQFASDLDWLKRQGIQVRRLNLAQEPSAFIDHPEVKALLERSGGDDLPAIVVGEKITWQGRYPNRTELAEAAGLTAGRTVEKAEVMNEGIKELIVRAADPAATPSTCCGGPNAAEPKAKPGCC